MPKNPLDGVLLQIFPRGFSDPGDFYGIVDHIDYLQYLGVSGVIIAGPPWEYGGTDGPYSPKVELGTLRVAPEFGGDVALQTLLDAFSEAGLFIIGDMVVNHMWAGSPLAEQMLAGDPMALDCVRIIHKPDPLWLQQPNLFGLAPLIPVPPELAALLGPDCFFRTTFYHDQLDLNGRSPVVLAYLAGVLKEAVRRGFKGMRLDAIGHVGTNYIETLNGLLTQTSFDLIRHLLREVPGVPLMAEVSGDRKLVAQYLQEGLCTMGYDLAFAGYALLALLREDYSILRDYMGTHVSIGQNARLCLTMGVHDDVNIGLMPKHLGEEVLNGLGGNGRYVVFGRALNQRLGMLTRGYKAHHALLRLMLCLPGTPVLHQGDAEWRQGNLEAHDREPRRDKMLYTPLESDHLPPGYASDALTPRVSIQEQMVKRDSPLNSLRNDIGLRNRSEALQVGDYRLIESSDSRAYTFSRSTDRESLIIASNPSRFPKKITMDLTPWSGQRLYEFAGRRWREIPGAKSKHEMFLEPESTNIFRPKK